ncbi:MAG TPA: OB-fold nucleic acid binding domain-containing protein, partial [Candidatus Dojkabacteria bacterium]|nr:OB-fold nucleic acid binding domain-containing protein [Candidatus Dojkabacteria bacterium]
QAEYLIPELEPILQITKGVITYQEQVIRIAVDIAGYSMGEADALRKAMGKKKMDVMEAEKPKFVAGAVAKGYKEEKILELWELLVKFANYGFNKAHSAMYATVAFWTAYLKAHYPLEFMAALLEGDLDNFERVVIDLEECEKLGFKLLPPDINKSDFYFTIEGDQDIRFGLAAIKNVGKDIMKTLVNERKSNGEYKNLDDLVYRTVDKKVQQRALENMIMAGAFDIFGDRQALIKILPTVFEKYKKQRKTFETGQMDIFGMDAEAQKGLIQATPLPQDVKTPTHLILQWEKDLLGLYFTSHPLNNLQEFFAEKGVTPIRQLKEKKPGSLIVLGGLITNVKRITTKKGERMAFLSVEDKTGATDVLVFPSKYEEMKDQFTPNKPVLIVGRLSERDGAYAVVFEKSMYIDQEKFATEFSGIIYKINQKNKQKDIDALKTFIKENPGDTPVKIIIKNKEGVKTVNLKQGIEYNEQAKEFLKKFA